MANVFITGATGFMGRRLSAELVARGHSVRGLVRRVYAAVAENAANPIDPADTLAVAAARDHVIASCVAR